MESVETERDPMEMALAIDVVLDNVLEHLKVTDLLSYRKVSKFWNKVASSVLRKLSTMMTCIYSKEDLMNLQECMELSLDFPFAGLKLDKPWQYNSGDAMEFFQNYGDRFTQLSLDTQWDTRGHDIAPFVNLLPRLSTLEVEWPERIKDRRADLLDSAAGREDGINLKLPSVRIIRFLHCDAGIENILQEIVMAASPSVQIECVGVKLGIVRALQSAGKLRSVSFMKFEGGIDDDRNAIRIEMDQLLSFSHIK